MAELRAEPINFGVFPFQVQYPLSLFSTHSTSLSQFSTQGKYQLTEN